MLYSLKTWLESVKNNISIKRGFYTNHKTNTRVVHKPLALLAPLRFLTKNNGSTLLVVKQYDKH